MRLLSLRSARSRARAHWLGAIALAAGVALALAGAPWPGAALYGLGLTAVLLAELARAEASADSTAPANSRR